MTTSSRFEFNFFAYTQKIDTPERFDALFSPEKSALLSLLKEVQPSPKRTCNYKTSYIG